MLIISSFLFILGLWFKFDGHLRRKRQNSKEHEIRWIADEDVIALWQKLNRLNAILIDCYSTVLPPIYVLFALIFFIFHLKQWTVPPIHFSDYPFITCAVTAVLFVITCFAGNLPVLMENDPYFTRRQSGQVCALDINAHQHNLVVLYKSIGNSRHSADALEHAADDIRFLNKAIFVAKHLDKIALIWHGTLIWLILLLATAVYLFHAC